VERKSFRKVSSISCVAFLLATPSSNPLARAAMAGGECGGCGNGASVIDPSISGRFRDLGVAQNKSNTPGVVEVDLDLRRTPVSVGGTTASLMTYNGAFRGPTIRLKRRDLLRINVHNSLVAATEKNMLGFQLKALPYSRMGLTGMGDIMDGMGGMLPKSEGWVHRPNGSNSPQSRNGFSGVVATVCASVQRLGMLDWQMLAPPRPLLQTFPLPVQRRFDSLSCMGVPVWPPRKCPSRESKEQLDAAALRVSSVRARAFRKDGRTGLWLYSSSHPCLAGLGLRCCPSPSA
jgi:hypothetical protein